MTYNYNEWIKNGKLKIYCKCECGKEIILKENHEHYYKYYGIPEYIIGHNNRNKKLPLRSEEYKKKLRERIFTDDHKNKLKISKIGKNNPNFNKYPSEITKQKMSENHRDISGKNNPLYGINRSKENNPNWRGGITNHPYCKKWTEKLREKIREEYNRKCYFCGKDEKDNIDKNSKIRKLSVHHVDNDKEQGCNGKSWKLVPLCMHCHNSRKMRILK